MFMPRDAMQDLINWKENPRHKPLLLNGARQVGKTELALRFGHENFQHVAYLQLDSSDDSRTLFHDFDMQRILIMLQARTEVPIIPGKTLLILDEVQEQPLAITALKYFCEQLRDLHVIASGSYLGLNVHEGTGFPVGKVNRLTLYPLTFSEFLSGVSKTFLREALHTGDPKIWQDVHDQLDTWLQIYLITGGMPEAITEFLVHNNAMESRQIQQDLLAAYGMGLSKHIPNELLPAAQLAWNMAPAQLSKENRRFIFSQITQSNLGKQMRVAIQQLADAGLLSLVKAVSQVQLPLAGFVQPQYFKPFFLDVGLLGAALKLAPSLITTQHELYAQHRGVMAEQYVIQSLLAITGETPYYYQQQKPDIKLDALITYDSQIYVIEVKSGVRVRSKSLNHAHEKFGEHLKYLRFSRAPYIDQGWMKNLPLYAVEVVNAWQ